jgi:ABC-type transport system involved in cytochrome c biogenesis ATPase subunit
MPDTPAILIQNLTVSYGPHRVLDGLSLQVPAGSITALLGGNGAGKSTTLAALLGFARAQSGVVSVCGIDPGADPDGARRKIAYLHENVALYEHLTAVENAEYLLALSGDPRRRGAITDAFAAAGLQARAWDQRLGGFSKGMRQKVGHRARAAAGGAGPAARRADVGARPPRDRRLQRPARQRPRPRHRRPDGHARPAERRRRRGPDRLPGGWPHRRRADRVRRGALRPARAPRPLLRAPGTRAA